MPDEARIDSVRFPAASPDDRRRPRRGRRALLSAFCFAAVAAAGSRASAVLVAGGSSPSDCLAAFDAPANQPASRPKNVVCVDGDPACDGDAAVNGSCQIAVSFCLNNTSFPGCTLNGVDSVFVNHAVDNGDPEFDPEFQALQNRIDNQLLSFVPNTTADDCTSVTNFRVPVEGPLGPGKCRKSKKKIRVTTVSDNFAGTVYSDDDKLQLTCVPAADAAGGCDPQTLFAGTFDRVQRQIFNQSCAVSACHDSQSHQSNLILESGATVGNLVNVVPTNSAASTAGWLRLVQSSPTSGDRTSSYVYRKVTGDLPDSLYGVRMPYRRARLHSTLREVIGLWIDAGAPQTGWVPGTD